MTYTEEQLWPGLRVTLWFYFCAEDDASDYICIPYTFSVPMGAEFCEHFLSSHGTAAMCMAQDEIGKPVRPMSDEEIEAVQVYEGEQAEWEEFGRSLP